MKITFIVTGRTGPGFLKEGLALYTNRLKHYTTFELVVVPDLKNTKNMAKENVKEAEGKLLLKLITPTDTLYLLDERGDAQTSEGFASFIEKKITAGCRNLVFIAGGPFGFSEQVYRLASGMISLSGLTFSHQMVRLIFIEQLYRAFTIIKGEPYHHS